MTPANPTTAFPSTEPFAPPQPRHARRARSTSGRSTAHIYAIQRTGDWNGTMQNMGVHSIVANVLNPTDIPHHTGMVVFYKCYTYDNDGYIAGEHLPKAAPVPLLQYFSAAPLVEGDKFRKSHFRIAGVTFIDNMNEDTVNHIMRATVHVAGAVAVCNTGCGQISAGDDVYAILGEDPKHTPEIISKRPEHAMFNLKDDEKERTYYLGRCVMGAGPSDLSGNRICLCQVMLATM